MTAIKLSLLNVLGLVGLESGIERLTNAKNHTNTTNLDERESGLCQYVDKSSISANCKHPTASDYKNACKYCIVSEEGVCINPKGFYQKL